MLYKTSKSFQIVKSVYANGKRLALQIKDRYIHIRLVLVFVFVARTISIERPMLKCLVLPSFMAIHLARIFRWGITGFTLYILFCHGIHLPLWIKVLSVFAGETLAIAIAAAEMEMKHYGYLSS